MEDYGFPIETSTYFALNRPYFAVPRSTIRLEFFLAPAAGSPSANMFRIVWHVSCDGEN